MAPSKHQNSQREEPQRTLEKVTTDHTSQVKKPEVSKAPPAEAPNKILEYSPIATIPSDIEKLTKNFHTLRKTHSLQHRLNQLRNIYFAIRDNIDDICDALYKDFYRSPDETRTLEYAPLMNELVHMMAHLHEWAKPEPVTSLPITQQSNPVYIERVPYGVVLVISPFNYPLLLSIGSLIGAIAGGNSVVLKVSELTPHFASVLTKALTKVLDPDTFLMVNGAIPETEALLNQKFDKIMYTGSTMVGKIIAKKAAENLTPVLLELGGKSPAFVLQDVKDKDIEVIARRIVWARFTNAGQTCVAIDYVLVHESLKDKLVSRIKSVIEEEFYASLSPSNAGYTHIIHQRAYENLKKMVSDSKGNLVIGAEFDDASRFISPTVFDDVKWSDSTMQQEIFGPVLPILTYSNLEDAILEVIKRHDTPLALYIFTSGSRLREKNAEVELIRKSIRSGGTIVNDAIMHVALANAPFGGIGNSGQGSYHGFFSFRAFTHERTTMEQSLNLDFVLKVRYPPSNEKKVKVIEQSMISYNDKVWFGRSGNVRVNGPNSLWTMWVGAASLGALAYHFVGAL